MRLFLASIGLALVATTAAQAEIVIGQYVYPDSEYGTLRQLCQGLEGQANQSAIDNRNDDDYNGDLGSAYQLKSVPFSVRDCRRAGFI
ncbi:MAG TPA: hypothetical protein VGD86_01090 [Devosia sp.]